MYDQRLWMIFHLPQSDCRPRWNSSEPGHVPAHLAVLRSWPLSYYTARPVPPARLPRQRVPPANAASGLTIGKASPYQSGGLSLIVTMRTATTSIVIPAEAVAAAGRILAATYSPSAIVARPTKKLMTV